MINILITGTGSYVGASFESWVAKWADEYAVDSIDLRDSRWEGRSFQGYDVVLHVAAIVHVKEKDTDKYFRVNRDLALDVARKAKDEGVKQFIFLSTMGVYGVDTGHIEVDAKPNPKTPYAKSKFEAEVLLSEMKNNTFQVAVLRPPLVYGKNCRGNYPRLARLALKLPFFPAIKNERSMIYVDNLSEFMRLIIDSGVGGLFFPQNREYVKTAELVTLIARAHGKELKSNRFFNLGVCLGLRLSGEFRKVFGSFVYAKGMPGCPGTIVDGQKTDYETVSFEESIRRTEE